MDLATIVLALAQKAPIVSSILMVVGIARLVIKPLLAIARSVVQATPSAADDAALDKVEQSSVLKGLLWALDYLFSIKIIK